MKSASVLLMVATLALFSADCLAQDGATFADLYRAGQAHEEAGRWAKARTEYESALAVKGITPDQTGKALVRIATVCIASKNERDAFDAINRAWALEGISNATRIEANIVYGQRCLLYPWVYEKVRDVFTEALSFPEITAEQKTVARKGLIRAYMGLRRFGEARKVLADIVSGTDLSDQERLAARTLNAKIGLLQDDFSGARDELEKALTIDKISNADRADIQLQLALSYYNAKDYEHAKPELLKVLTMPGAGAYRRQATWDCGYTPADEAKLRLCLQNLVPSDEPEVAVLFIGSSMTSRGEMPRLLPEMCTSTLSGRPRIVFSMFARNGTGMKAFWEEGNELPGTPQRVIMSEPWDVVVLETFHTMTREDLLKYGGLFAGLAQSRKIKPIFYEAHPPLASPYPETTQRFHEDNLAASKALDVSLAPVALAEMYYLEANPTAKREEFYDDWIHPSQKGMYMAACCVYSTITGYSPVGLRHPNRIADEEAKAMQEAAWKAVQETNPDLKPWTDSRDPAVLDGSLTK